MPTASFIESPWAFATLTQMLVSYPALTGRAYWIIYALMWGRPQGIPSQQSRFHLRTSPLRFRRKAVPSMSQLRRPHPSRTPLSERDIRARFKTGQASRGFCKPYELLSLENLTPFAGVPSPIFKRLLSPPWECRGSSSRGASTTGLYCPHVLPTGQNFFDQFFVIFSQAKTSCTRGNIHPLPRRRRLSPS